MIADPLADGGVSEPLYPLPPEENVEALKKIHDLARDYKDSGNAARLESAVKKALQFPGFADYLKDVGMQQVRGTSDAWQVIIHMVYWFLAQQKFIESALLLWGPSVFTPEPRSVRLIWQAITDAVNINVMGGSSQGKSYSPAVWLFLNWLLDPDYTRIILVSTKMEKVKRDLFDKVANLHKNALITLPGSVDTESITIDKKSGFGIFVEVASGAGLKGIKRTKRVTPHPLFGDTSRLFILVDEAQEVPVNFFVLLPNIQAGVGSDPLTGKLIMCANPSNQFSQYGINCEPEAGWEDGANKRDTWLSKSGWTCVRLNAMKSENYLARREIYKGFFTYLDYKRNLRQAAGDEDAPSMWTYVYGMFPPQGDRACLIPSRLIDRSKREWLFEGPTENWGSCDPAYVSDDATFAFGRTGKSSSYRTDDGVIHTIEKPCYVVQADGLVILPKGDPVAIAEEVMKRAQVLRLKPSNLAIDITGNTSVRDIVEVEWNKTVLGLKENHPEYNTRVSVCGVMYSGKPSTVTVLMEDSVIPVDAYKNMASELWFACSKWLEANIVGIGRGIDEQTMTELTTRRGVSSDKSRKSRVEGKDDFKARGNKSPDRADAFTMLIHAIRMASPWKPGLVAEGKNTAVDQPLPYGAPNLSSGLTFGQSMDLKGFGSTEVFSNKN